MRKFRLFQGKAPDVAGVFQGKAPHVAGVFQGKALDVAGVAGAPDFSDFQKRESTAPRRP